MAGINARTLKPLGSVDHVVQSLTKALTTGLGERFMREWCGSPGRRLLGENATDRVLLKWWTITYMVVEIFEPRFKIKRFEVAEITRLGEAIFLMEGEYRLTAHRNFIQARVYVAVDKDGVTVRAA